MSVSLTMPRGSYEEFLERLPEGNYGLAATIEMAQMLEQYFRPGLVKPGSERGLFVRFWEDPEETFVVMGREWSVSLTRR